ncbi:hypothetical protein Daesc_002606 [Daldinia eschscholtzii]|uniref:Major facilitator superfamily (MFS) profile domain-containing protein n=1 Tax=Daldinia eschscholtzii TaxID=292717 RepID=A0AAX6MR38_9PEZI
MSSGVDKLPIDSEKPETDSQPDTASVSRQESLAEPDVSRIRSSSLARIRSNNGHGCADLEEGDATDDSLTPDQRQAEKDPFEVAWDGDDDPLCPRSMATARKWLAVITVGMGSLCVTCTLGLSLFVLGIALGPLLMSPLSEFIGRRPIYLASWAMFLIWLIPSAVARNIATILVARFIDGFAGSSFLSVAGGTVSDMFRRDQIQAPMVIVSLSPFIGPSLGPLLGGFINYNTSWRWTHYTMIIWAFVEFVMIFIFAPETYHPIKLREKARKLRKETGDDRWKAPMEKSTKSVALTIGYSLLRPFELLIFEPMCLLLCLFSAILLGVLYLFFGAFPLVFGNTYGFNLWQTGLSFLGIFIGMIIAAATDPIWRRINLRLLEQNKGVPEPEFRLPPAIAGAIAVPIGLFIFAWAAYPWVHWIGPIIGSAIFGLGTLLVFTGIFTFLGVLLLFAGISDGGDDAIPLSIFQIWKANPKEE